MNLSITNPVVVHVSCEDALMFPYYSRLMPGDEFLSGCQFIASTDIGAIKKWVKKHGKHYRYIIESKNPFKDPIIYRPRRIDRVRRNEEC